MPIFHATLYFSWGRDYSWVEQFWRESPDRASALASAVELASARFSILGDGATIYRARVCQADTPRACISVGIRGRPLSAPADMPIGALEVKLTSSLSSAHWRNYPLRGLPLAWFQVVGSRAVLNPAYRPQVDSWLSLLVNRQWLLQVEQALGPALPIRQLNLVGIGDADIYGDPLHPADPPLGQSVVGAILDSPPPLSGDLVAVQAVRPTPDLPAARRAINGTYPVYLTTPNAVYWVGDLGGADNASGGTVQLRQVRYLPISDWVYRRRVARKCGPFREAGELADLPAVPPAMVRYPSARPDEIKTMLGGGIAEHQFDTLGDIAREIFRGYTEPTTPNDPLIGITKRVNTLDLEYAVFIGGVDLHILKPSWQQYADALLSLASAPDDYTDYVRQAIKQRTPEGCKLHLFGHSLGGMAAQWMLSVWPGIGNRQIKTCVGFGTAWIVSGVSLFPFEGVPTKRLFMVQNDPVPYLGPAGLAFPARVALTAYTASPAEEISLFLLQQALPWNQTRLLPGPDLPLDDLVGRHNCYPTLATCDDYWWDGERIADTPQPGRPRLITAFIDRILYPPL